MRSKKVEIQIEGLGCASCANSLEKALQRTNGVKEVSVNSSTGRAPVVYDTSATSYAALKEVVESAGYSIVETGYL